MVAQDIKKKALELNFTSCGIIPAETFREYEQYLDDRVAAFPESKEFYSRMYNNVHLPESAKSIIVCIRRYNKYAIPEGLDKWVGKNYLFDGRVSYSNEYRDKTEFEMFLKIGGLNLIECMVPDRWAAAKANLGKFGRNNFIYDPNHGSFLYIYTWVVDKALDYDEPTGDYLMQQCGIHCQKCIEACPTKALEKSLSMNMPACAAFLSSFSASGTISSEEVRQQMGQLLYGCDVCQDVCPANQDKFVEDERFPLIDLYEQILKLENILAMDEETYENILNPRFWYAGPDGLWLWKCNALRAMINSGDSKYHDLITQCCSHDDSRVREIAEWGCKKLGIRS